MKASSRRIAFFLAYITIAGSLWTASQWWEKGLAESVDDPLVSPGGCYRVEKFKPFWALPSIFHPLPDPNGDRASKWLHLWSRPGFYKLYDNRSNELLGESNIYDLEFVGSGMLWGGGTDRVFAGLIDLGPSLADCLDEV